VRQQGRSYARTNRICAPPNACGGRPPVTLIARSPKACGARSSTRSETPLTAEGDLRPVRVSVADIDSVATEWDELAARTGASPFVRPGWIRAWWGSFGRGDLRLLAARRDGALVGVLPLGLRHGALCSPTNEHTPAFDVVAADDAAARAVTDSLFAVRVRTVRIGRLAGGGTARAGLETSGARAGYRMGVTPVARSPYIACAPKLEDHERGLSSNLRHDVERRMRRLCEQGAVVIDVTDGGTNLARLLDEGFRVEALSWKGAQGTAIASDARTRRFYDAVARWASARGWLRLAFLRLDGRAIAFQFDLEVERTYFSLKIGYDPAFDSYSPGKLLTYAMVARAVSTGLATYELLGTNDPWKDRWTSNFREYVRLEAYAPSRSGTVSWAVVTHGRRLARRIPLMSRVAAALRR
jgi:CelD/BcsL family acetyltransferase involved in cellulose biosynthesis